MDNNIMPKLSYIISAVLLGIMGLYFAYVGLIDNTSHRSDVTFVGICGLFCSISAIVMAINRKIGGTMGIVALILWLLFRIYIYVEIYRHVRLDLIIGEFIPFFCLWILLIFGVYYHKREESW